MKFYCGFLALALALNCVLALPARSPSDDAELIDVPRRSQRPSANADDDADAAGDDGFHNFKGVIDTGSGYPFLQSVPHPFSFNLGIFDSFEDIFRRLRTQLWSEADAADDFPGISLNYPDPKKGNTTHTVKVVDGHKIEINDTVYGDNNSVFKVRVVNIHPLESGESVPETETETKVNVAPSSPVTSAPPAAAPEKTNRDTEHENSSEASDERREPLESHDKKPSENEINDNIDDPEIAIEMLPTTTTTTPTIDEADAANLNAEFVTDNTLASGSEEAETNRADDANMEHFELEQQQQLNNDEETALAAELSDELTLEAQAEEDASNNEQLTVQDNNNNNNEEANNSETADNFNESQDENDNDEDDDDDDEAKELSKLEEAKETTANDDDALEGNGDGDDEAAKLSVAEFNEETQKAIDAVSSAAEFDAESISITQEKDSETVEDSDVDDDDESDDDARPSHKKHSNYKQREDVTSSDDEDATNMQMHPQFDAEWADLTTNDETNDLSNDIEIYDAVAPVDLSNDLVVNDIAASQPGYPLNPDAEFIEVDGKKITEANVLGPKFEKISLDGGLYSTMSYHHQQQQQQPHEQQYSQNFK